MTAADASVFLPERFIFEKDEREAPTQRRRPKVSGKNVFFRETAGRKIQRFKLKLLYDRSAKICRRCVQGKDREGMRFFGNRR